MNRWLGQRTVLSLAALGVAAPVQAGLERVAFNNPGLVVDLAVGLWAWPLPMDYDGDGKLDLLVNSQNVHVLVQAGSHDRGETLFRDQGRVDARVLAGHDTAPTVVDWNGDGTPDLLVGAEDGHFYSLEHHR